MHSTLRFFKPITSHPIPQLTVLDKIVELTQHISEMPNLDKTAFIGVQHLLETTGTLFQSLIKIGVKPENMFFAGKCYSTSPTVADSMEQMGINILRGSIPDRISTYQTACKKDVKQLWEKFSDASKQRNFERVIILDDGGRCIEEMPHIVPFYYCTASIEQTRGGLYSSSLDNIILPLIEVASSAVKKHIESPFIAEAVLTKLKKIMPNLNPTSKTVCGVVGNGAIGNAITQYLLSLGCTVILYDENNKSLQNEKDKKLYRLHNLDVLLANCSIVFGCTGKDITQNVKLLDVVESDITLISCTSEDREFLSILKKIAEENKRIYFDPLSDVTFFSNRGHKITIMKGGFPINFDNEPWNVPAKYIAITQALMFVACIQATIIANKPVNDGITINEQTRHMLNPYAQQRVLKEWMISEFAQLYPQELLNHFDDIEWIKKHSGGVYYPHLAINNGFNSDINSQPIQKYSRAKL